MLQRCFAPFLLLQFVFVLRYGTYMPTMHMINVFLFFILGIFLISSTEGNQMFLPSEVNDSFNLFVLTLFVSILFHMFNQNRIYRLFQLINYLKSRPAKSIQSIINYLNTSERTVYRYVELLKDLGFSVEKRYT